MKAIINFKDQTVTINGETCNFYEAGVYNMGAPVQDFYPKNRDEFEEQEHDVTLNDKGIDEIEYEKDDYSTIHDPCTKQRLRQILDERGFNLDNYDEDYETAIDNYNWEYNCLDAEFNGDFIDYCLENWS